MKQLLPSIIALVIAIGLSSFTLAEKQSREEEVFLYWHPVDSSTGFVFGLPSGPAFKSEMIGGGCSDETTPICYYGSDTYEDLRTIYVGDVMEGFRLIRESY